MSLLSKLMSAAVREVELSLSIKTCSNPYYNPWLADYILHASRTARKCLPTLCRHASSAGRGQLGINHYESLGVGQQATQAEIKSAYYALSKVYHPDLSQENTDAGARFRQITAAYEMLGNPLTRKQYDRETGLGRQQKVPASAAVRRRMDKYRHQPPGARPSVSDDPSAQQYAKAGGQWRERAEEARKKHEAEQQQRGFQSTSYKAYDDFILKESYSAVHERVYDTSSTSAANARAREQSNSATWLVQVVALVLFVIVMGSFVLGENNYHLTEDSTTRPPPVPSLKAKEANGDSKVK